MVSRCESTTDAVAAAAAAETSIFYKLPSRELLKHLLAAEDCTRASSLPSRQPNDSYCKEQNAVSQNVPTFFIDVNQYDYGVYTTSNHQVHQTCNSISSVTTAFHQNGCNMEEENTDQQKDFSPNSTSTDDDLLLLSSDILAEAHQILSLDDDDDESSSRQQECDFYDLQSLSSSLCEIGKDPSDSTLKRRFIYKNVNSREDDSGSVSGEQTKCVKESEDNVNASDSDVEANMVLVPAGNAKFILSS